MNKKLKIIASTGLVLVCMATFTACGEDTFNDIINRVESDISNYNAEHEDSSNTSSQIAVADNTDVSRLSDECRKLYAGVKSGTINNADSKNADGTSVNFAADKNSSSDAKGYAAAQLTIDDVLTYSGLAINLKSVYFCSGTEGGTSYHTGDIVYGKPTVSGCDWKKLTVYTRLCELYPEV